MNGADENRMKRRSKKDHKKRHGQRGGSGKRSHLIVEIIKERGVEVQKKRVQRPANR